MPLHNTGDLDARISALRSEIIDGEAKLSTFRKLEKLIDERISNMRCPHFARKPRKEKSKFTLTVMPSSSLCLMLKTQVATNAQDLKK